MFRVYKSKEFNNALATTLSTSGPLQIELITINSKDKVTKISSFLRNSLTPFLNDCIEF